MLEEEVLSDLSTSGTSKKTVETFWPAERTRLPKQAVIHTVILSFYGLGIKRSKPDTLSTRMREPNRGVRREPQDQRRVVVILAL